MPDFLVSINSNIVNIQVDSKYLDGKGHQAQGTECRK